MEKARRTAASDIAPVAFEAKSGLGTRKQSAAKGLMVALTTILYEGFMLWTARLPQRFAFRIVWQVGATRYRRRRLATKRCQASMARLLRVEPELAQGWLRRSFELAACADLERYLLPRMTEEGFLRRVGVRGLENLDRALNRGKGAILYSGHVWSSFTVPFALGVLGYKVNWVGRRSRDNSTRIE